MRRVTAVVGAVVMALAMVAGPAAAARAAEPLPPGPVNPIGTLPSTYQKSVFTGASLMDDQIKFAAWVVQQSKAAAASGSTAAAVSTAVPVAPAAPLKAGAAGSALTGAFMAGWMITDGTLAMYANVTGDDPMMGTCALTGLAQGAVQILYPFSAPDCKADIIANQDVLGGEPTLTYGGVTVIFKGSAAPTYCFTRSAGLPTGYTLSAKRSDGTSSGITFGSSGTSYGVCSNNGWAAPNGNTGWTNSAVPVTGARVVRSSDGEVVAETVAPVADPGRVPRCDVKWRDGSTTSAVGTSSYNDTGGAPLGLFSSLCNDAYVSKPGRGPALMPSEIKIGSTREDTGAYTEIQNNPVPEYTEEEQRGLTAPAPGGGLVLQKVVNGAVQSCNTWEANCTGWWTATQNGTVTETETGTYRCTWNGSEVALNECGPYRNTFDTQTQTPTITDPFTGEEVPWSSGAPGWSTITPTVTGGGGCGAAFSFNPADWVINPLKCLFIPSTAKVQTVTNTMVGAWSTTMLGQLPLIIGPAFLPPEGDSSCQGPHIYMDFSGWWDGWPVIDWYPLNACTAPMSHVAATARAIGAAILIYFTALGIVRRISAVVNAPGLGGGN